LLPQPASLEKNNIVVSNTFKPLKSLKKTHVSKRPVIYNMTNIRKSDSDTNVEGLPNTEENTTNNANIRREHTVGVWQSLQTSGG
jgi:hypothetical protein